jgi:diguanylate cyclase (GGDEF)-like protein
VEICWGLELERLDQPDEAGVHFSAALAIADGAEPLPPMATHSWSLRLRALVGLCQAMTDSTDLAIPSLEETIGELADQSLEEEAMARLGLVRAYAEIGDPGRARAEAERAEASLNGHDHHELALSLAWERQRLARASGRSPSAAVVTAYASRLEHERWDDRVRFAAETRTRVQSEIERRAARKMSAEYLTDATTGVANRRHLELRLPEMVSRARTHEETVALAFIDLDAETSTEDLVSIGASLRSKAGADGFVARYGGCEFVVVLPRQTARQLADVVDDVVGSRRADGVPRPRVGVASALRPPSVAGLMAAADEALLAARRAGGGIQLAVT